MSRWLVGGNVFIVDVVQEREWVDANCVAVHVAEPVFQQRDGKRQRLICS